MSHQDLLGEDLDQFYGKIKVRTTHITSAQLLDLHNTPVELVPAADYIVPLQIVARYNPGTTPYVVPNNVQLGAFRAVDDVASSCNAQLYLADLAGVQPALIASVMNAQDFSIASTSLVCQTFIQAGGNAAMTSGDGTLDVTVVYVVVG